MEPPATPAGDKIAKIVSSIFSPFLVISVASLILTFAHTDTWQQLALYWITFVGSVVFLPLCWILIGIRTHNITDLHVRLREQRLAPLLVAIAGSCISLTALHYERAPLVLIAMVVALFADGIIFYVCTLFWKISLHSSSLAGAIALLGFSLHYRWFWLLLLIPLVIWARLKRKRHTVWQGVIASGLAILTVFVVFKLFELT